MLWFEQIFPTLFVFTILSNVILASNAFSGVSERYIMLVIFVLGCFFGFPIGAKLSNDFCKNGYISSRYIEYLSAFSNHFSIPFIITYTFIEHLNMSNGLLPYILALYAPSVLGMFILIFIIPKNSTAQKIPASRFNFDIQIVDAGIINGFETLIKLCGYIVLFSVLVQIPRTLSVNAFEITFLCSFLEATNGIHIICNAALSEHIALLLSIAILSFGGISCILQTKAIFTSENFKIHKYILIKCAMCLCSLLISTAFLKFFDVC